MAYYAHKLAFHIKDNKGFKFDDFTGLLGEDFMDNLRNEQAKKDIEWRNQMRVNG